MCKELLSRAIGVLNAQLLLVASLLQFLSTGLKACAENGRAIGMEHWHFFYVDERCVPLTSEDSNHAAAGVLYQRVSNVTVERSTLRHLAALRVLRQCFYTFASAMR